MQAGTHRAAALPTGRAAVGGQSRQGQEPVQSAPVRHGQVLSIKSSATAMREAVHYYAKGTWKPTEVHDGPLKGDMLCQ